MEFFQFFSLVLNFFLCLDIILTLRSPFYPHERRMKKYKIFGPLIAGMMTAVTARQVKDHETLKEFFWENTYGCLMITAYILFAIFSCAYCYRLTTKAGMSSEVRHEFIRRQIWYSLVYILTWLPFLGQSYYSIYVCSLEEESQTIGQVNKIYDKLGFWFSVNVCSALLTGFAMSFVRISEPVFWHLIKSSVYQYFGELAPEKKSDSDGNTLLSFLMSSLNIELVHIILTVVS